MTRLLYFYSRFLRHQVKISTKVIPRIDDSKMANETVISRKSKLQHIFFPVFTSLSQNLNQGKHDLYVMFVTDSGTSNEDPDSTVEDKEEEPTFDMTSMPLHLQLYHSFLQVNILSYICTAQ